MTIYYVNDQAQAGGDHEVHKDGCSYMPEGEKTYLGDYSSCGAAVTTAKTIYTQPNGCYHCCKPCHTS